MKIPVYNEGVLNRHRPRAAGYLNSEFTCQQISRFSTTAIIFINGHDLFYNGGNSPESLQAYDPALGGYIIQIEITCKSHVAASMHHDTWGLMQSHFYWPY